MILRAVQAGETFEISDHGEIVALLSPPTRRPYESLLVRKARRKGGFSALPLVQRGESTQAILDDLRGDR
ncbi:MAG TPA: hypothetical protein VG317_09200 [Pseudonocardiaceae bacterium]|nr:hypothetical protein [Pseudonocardiaceae bacterium]